MSAGGLFTCFEVIRLTPKYSLKALTIPLAIVWFGTTIQAQSQILWIALSIILVLPVPSPETISVDFFPPL